MTFREWFTDFIVSYDWEPLRAVENSDYFCNIVTGKVDYWLPHLEMLESAGIDNLPFSAKILDLGTWFGILPFALKQYGFTNVYATDRLSESEFKRKEFDFLWNYFDIQPYDLNILPNKSFQLDQKYDLILVAQSNFYWKTNQVFCHAGGKIDRRWQVKDAQDVTYTFFSPFDRNELEFFNNNMLEYLNPQGKAIIHPSPWVYNQAGMEQEQEYLKQFQVNYETSHYVLQNQALPIVDPNDWKDKIWVNKSDKTFFVPIWRCGNTTFMNYCAYQLGFELLHKPDVTGYNGIAFVRDPRLRLVSSILMVQKNTGVTVDFILEKISENNIFDEHLIQQIDFIKNYTITSYIDLDNYKNYQPKNRMESIIIKTLEAYTDNYSSDANKQQVFEIVNQPQYKDIVDNYMAVDTVMFNKFGNT